MGFVSHDSRITAQHPRPTKAALRLWEHNPAYWANFTYLPGKFCLLFNFLFTGNLVASPRCLPQDAVWRIGLYESSAE